MSYRLAEWTRCQPAWSLGTTGYELTGSTGEGAEIGRGMAGETPASLVRCNGPCRPVSPLP